MHSRLTGVIVFAILAVLVLMAFIPLAHAQSTVIELSVGDGAVVCPSPQLGGTWDASTNTCSLNAQNPVYIAQGVTLQVDSGVTLLLSGQPAPNTNILDLGGSAINYGTVSVSSCNKCGEPTFTIDFGATFENYGTLTSTDGCPNDKGSLLNYGTIDAYAPGNDCGGFFIAGIFDNHGALNVFGGASMGCRTICPTMVNEGDGTITVENGGSLSLTVGSIDASTGGSATTNYGKMEVSQGGSLGIGGGQSISDTFDNYGTVRVDGGVGVQSAGVLTNEGGGTITNNGGVSVSPQGSLTNDGTIQGTGNFYVAGTVANSGSFNSGGLNSDYGATFTNAGTVDLTGGGGLRGTITNLKGATFIVGPNAGIGTIGTFTNYGTIIVYGNLGTKSPSVNPGPCTLDNFGTIDNYGAMPEGGVLINEASGVITNVGAGYGEGLFSQGGSFNGSPITGTIDNRGTIINQGDFFDNFALTNEGTIDSSGNFGTAPGSTFTNSGKVQINANWDGLFGSVTNLAGGVFATDPASGFGVIGTFANYGTVDATFGVNGTFANYNTVNIPGYGYMHTTPYGCANDVDNFPGTFDNLGSLNVAAGGSVHDAGVVVNEVTGTISNYGWFGVSAGSCNGVAFSGTLANSGTLQNSGTVDNYGTVDNQATGTISNPGTILNECGAVYIDAGAFNGNPVQGNCPSSTSVTSSSSSVVPGTSVTLTGTVTDGSATASAPTGTLVWNDGGAGGTFSNGGSCSLVPKTPSSSGCSVTYTAPALFASLTITASYSGDNVHQQSSGSTTLTVAYRSCPNVPNGGGANLKGADLEYCDLAGYNLSNDNLQGANLFGANLAGADLAGANLLDANLSGAYAPGANFTGANGNSADFAGGNFSGANFTEANLQSSNFTNADVSNAKFTNANLLGANFSGANTTGADFTGANVHGATLGIPIYTATSLGGIAAGPNGNVFFVETPSSTEADLYVLSAGGTAPTQVFSLNVPSADLGVSLTEIHFDAKGNVYFVTIEYTSIGQTAMEVDSQVYSLSAGSGYAAKVLATAQSQAPQPCCLYPITSGSLYGNIAVDGSGNVFIGSSVFTLGSGAQSELLYLASGSSAPVERANLGPAANTFAIGDNIVINSQGDVFLAAPGSIYEVPPTGNPVSLNTPAAFIGMDGSGDLFYMQRTIAGRQCAFLAQSTTITIGYFSASTLSTSNPTSKIESQITYNGYMALFAGDSDLFAVSSGGTVYYQLLTSLRTSCSSPIAFATSLYALPLGDSSPTVLASAPPNSDIFFFTVSGNSFYYADAGTGVIFKEN